MPMITCPECGTITDLPGVDRVAHEFCGNCDFPLFWAQDRVPVAVGAALGEGEGEAFLRRLPGAGGRDRAVIVVCRTCGEHNDRGVERCIRCHNDLAPPPPPPPVEPEPEPEPEPEVREIEVIVMWPYTAAVLALLLVAIVGVLSLL